MATTRLGQFGVGVEPYGTFDPKDPAPTSDPHNPGLITRLSQFGVGAAKYGTFEPKIEAVVVSAAVIGGGRRPKRRRYLLPDDVLVVATEDEILEILRAMEPEEVVVKPQEKAVIRAKGKHSPEIKKRTLKSGVVKITIPQTWAPDPNIYPILIKKLQEREEEEIVIMLATVH